MFDVAEATGYVKAHPYQVGLLALMAGTALYLVAGGGSSSATTVAAGSAAPSESFQLQSMQLGNALQIAQAQAATASRAIAGQVDIAGIQSQTQSYLGKLTTDAAVAIQTLLSGVQAKNIDAAEAVQIANINATSLTQNNAINAGVTQAQIAANTTTTVAQISADTTTHIVDRLTPTGNGVTGGGGHTGGGDSGNTGYVDPGNGCGGSSTTPCRIVSPPVCNSNQTFNGTVCVDNPILYPTDPVVRNPPVDGGGNATIICGPGFFVDAFGHCSADSNSGVYGGGDNARSGPTGYSHDSVAGVGGGGMNI